MRNSAESISDTTEDDNKIDPQYELHLPTDHVYNYTRGESAHRSPILATGSINIARDTEPTLVRINNRTVNPHEAAPQPVRQETARTPERPRMPTMTEVATQEGVQIRSIEDVVGEKRRDAEREKQETLAKGTDLVNLTVEAIAKKNEHQPRNKQTDEVLYIIGDKMHRASIRSDMRGKYLIITAGTVDPDKGFVPETPYGTSIIVRYTEDRFEDYRLARDKNSHMEAKKLLIIENKTGKVMKSPDEETKKTLRKYDPLVKIQQRQRNPGRAAQPAVATPAAQSVRPAVTPAVPTPNAVNQPNTNRITTPPVASAVTPPIPSVVVPPTVRQPQVQTPEEMAAEYNLAITNIQVLNSQESTMVNRIADLRLRLDQLINNRDTPQYRIAEQQLEDQRNQQRQLIARRNQLLLQTMRYETAFIPTAITNIANTDQMALLQARETERAEGRDELTYQIRYLNSVLQRDGIQQPEIDTIQAILQSYENFDLHVDDTGEIVDNAFYLQALHAFIEKNEPVYNRHLSILVAQIEQAVVANPSHRAEADRLLASYDRNAIRDRDISTLRPFIINGSRFARKYVKPVAARPAATTATPQTPTPTARPAHVNNSSNGNGKTPHRQRLVPLVPDNSDNNGRGRVPQPQIVIPANGAARPNNNNGGDRRPNGTYNGKPKRDVKYSDMDN